MKTIIASVALLTCISCAHTSPNKITAGPTVAFSDVKEGLRPANCVQPPKFYNGLDISLETCRWNVNENMPAVCGFLGKKIMNDDQVFICGAVMVQDTCKSKYRLTMTQCVLPVEKPEEPLNKDQ